ncbi:hypothetical protein StoSoilB3_39900 [Arthrobacter sp. StoSoilB3]|nr:hypothetical protein StoSoilB3_39900 [Arthrobacter sp. StoSoilB3]
MPRRPYNWLPGFVAGRGSILLNGAGCSLNFAEVYPFGLWVQISVRFRGPLTLEQQRDIDRQVGAYLRNSPAEGPLLTIDQDGSGRSTAEIVTHEGHNNFWTISFWVDHKVAAGALSVVFTWTGQDIEMTFSVTGEDVDSALSTATELWKTSSVEYSTF